VARIHDLGGMEGFGAVDVTEDVEPFHADWEARLFALNTALIRRGVYGLDELRDAVERLAPATYLRCSYYERWYLAMRLLLAEKGVLAANEPADDAAGEPANEPADDVAGEPANEPADGAPDG
jgi:nitrile hydratase